MRCQDGPGHDAVAKIGISRAPLRQPAEDVEDVRFGLLRDVAPGAVDLSQASATRAMRP